MVVTSISSIAYADESMITSMKNLNGFLIILRLSGDSESMQLHNQSLKLWNYFGQSLT